MSRYDAWLEAPYTDDCDADDVWDFEGEYLDAMDRRYDEMQARAADQQARDEEYLAMSLVSDCPWED
jgi:hypothetical protein